MKPSLKLYLFILSFVCTIFYYTEKAGEYNEFIFAGLIATWTTWVALVVLWFIEKRNTKY